MMNFIEFVRESNRIEGILREPTAEEVEATEAFVIGLPPTVESVCALALLYTEGKGKLREREGMNVRVGTHRPVSGGPVVKIELEGLLDAIQRMKPCAFHIAYETLHPFLDGNGRTGRALWAWQMWRDAPYQLRDLGFLHSFYYQALEASR